MQEAKRKTRGTGVLVAVLVLVNGIAIWGQAGWASEHVAPQMFRNDFLGMPLAHLAIVRLIGSLVLAAALELTGVFLSIKADEADQKGLPSGGLRLGSYAAGLLSGALNFSHWEGTAAKISLGFLSAVSPFLWGVHARVRRGEVAAPSRRLWHPIASVRLIREMAWEGVAEEEEMLRRRNADVEMARLLEKMETRDREMEEALGAEMLAEMDVRAPLLLTGAGKTETLLPLEEMEALELENVRSISPAAPRAPRVSGDVEKAIEMLAGDAPKGEILSVSSVSPTTYGRLAKVFRMVRADRGARIDYRAEKVRPEHVEMMRRALAR